MLLLSAVAALPSGARAADVRPAPADAAALGREALAALASGAADPDPEARAAVAGQWGELGNRAAIPALRKALADRNADVRIAAAASLLKLGDVQGMLALIDETKPFKSGPSATPADELRRMARDAARARAALKLGETGREASVAALRSALEDPAGEVRDAAAAALARLGVGDTAAFVEALKDRDEGVRAAAARALGQAGRAGLEELKKAAAADASSSVRAEAAAALGSFSDPGSLAQLAACLEDKSPRVRLAAARGLARRTEPAAGEALKRLSDRAPAVELALTAAAALAARGVEVDAGVVELTLSHKDPDLKALAVSALGASRLPRARELLVKVMRDDPDGRVRALAAGAVIFQLRRGGGK